MHDTNPSINNNNWCRKKNRISRLCCFLRLRWCEHRLVQTKMSFVVFKQKCFSEQGEPITFCEESFVSHRSSTMKNFLSMAVNLQLFKQVQTCVCVCVRACMRACSVLKWKECNIFIYICILFYKRGPLLVLRSAPSAVVCTH